MVRRRCKETYQQLFRCFFSAMAEWKFRSQWISTDLISKPQTQAHDLPFIDILGDQWSQNYREKTWVRDGVGTFSKIPWSFDLFCLPGSLRVWGTWPMVISAFFSCALIVWLHFRSLISNPRHVNLRENSTGGQWHRKTVKGEKTRWDFQGYVCSHMRDPQNERPRNSIGGFAFLVFRLRFRRFWLGCLRHAAIPRMGRVEISYLFQTLSTHSCANDAESREDHTERNERHRKKQAWQRQNLFLL